MMRYSIEPSYRISFKHGFFSFVQYASTNLGSRYRQKVLDDSKKYATYAVMTASKEQF